MKPVAVALVAVGMLVGIHVGDWIARSLHWLE